MKHDFSSLKKSKLRWQSQRKKLLHFGGYVHLYSQLCCASQMGRFYIQNNGSCIFIISISLMTFPNDAIGFFFNWKLISISFMILKLWNLAQTFVADAFIRFTIHFLVLCSKNKNNFFSTALVITFIYPQLLGHMRENKLLTRSDIHMTGAYYTHFIFPC